MFSLCSHQIDPKPLLCL